MVDKLVEFLITWRMQTKERTGRVSTQGPDQIIPYCTSKSFLMMHETLVKLENLLNELGASDLLSSSPNSHGYPYGGKLFLSDEKRRPDAYAA